MREIKFRALNLENNKMLYQDKDFGYVSSRGVDLLPLDAVEKNRLQYTNRVILMQYINLRDKNGKEIYENDIVIFDNSDIGGHKIIGKIIFNTDQTLSNLEWGILTQNGYFSTNFLGTIEVIGNIYENPELQWTKW